MSASVLLITFAHIAIAICIGGIIIWGIKKLEVPAEPAKYLIIIVYVVIGVYCILQLLGLLGISVF
jgi:hypothetical protein